MVCPKKGPLKISRELGKSYFRIKELKIQHYQVLTSSPTSCYIYKGGESYKILLIPEKVFEILGRCGHLARANCR